MAASSRTTDLEFVPTIEDDEEVAVADESSDTDDDVRLTYPLTSEIVILLWFSSGTIYSASDLVRR